LNFKKVDSTLEQFDPERTTLRSEERTEETGEMGGSKENVISNYEVNRTLQHIIETFGNVEHLSVALTIDPTAIVLDDQGNPTLQNENPVMRQRSQEEIDQLAEVVKRAVGFTETRGDQFKVTPVRFDKSTEWQKQRAIAAEERKDFWTNIVTNAAKLIGIVAALFMLYSIVRAFEQSVRAPVIPVPPGVVVPPGGVVVPGLVMPEEEEEIVPRLVETERQQMINRISAMVGERPDDAARIIRSLIRGE
ncbi:MAG: hypothetical protein HY709_02715, partial [Candidatus Latescibacteria bacterium]|nr:hypothetical protein [Candidatus Latescibacterota bacterium]